MIEVTSKEQLDALKAAHRLVVVDFYAPWCGACPKMLDMLKEVEGETPEIPFVKVDIDALPELKEEYRIKAIPMVLFLRLGRSRDFMFGAPDAEKFRKKMRMQREALANVEGTSVYR